ncbi:class I SAM-dependent methyltransferase [Streptococcaceae bacterium ESL0687]|nr:class I SAM-dependent methyltransferase [Streptococcaceae bacterium ESL0687]
MAIYEDFARVYDSIMDDSLYDAWYDFSIRHASKNTKKILELACGTGKLSLKFAEEGYKVYGLDFSEEMLTIAYNRAVDADLDVAWIEGDMRDLGQIDTYDLVTCYSDSICYMPNQEEVQKVFDEVYSSLNDEGTFIFDVHSTHQIDQVFPGYSYHENDEDFAFVWDSYPGLHEHSITHELTFFVKDEEDGKFIRRDEIHDERTYTIYNYQIMLENAGFSSVEVYADFEDEQPKEDSARWFFVCKK